jgi:exonuclease III
MLRDIDPDDNFLNEIFPSFNQAHQSQYYSVERYNQTYVNSPPCLSIFHSNVCSFNANGELLTSTLSSLTKTPDIIAMTETWFNNSNVDLSCIEGYNSHNTIRPHGMRGGGVSVSVDQRLSSVKLIDLCISSNTIETCVVRVVCNSEEIVIFALYRPHSDSVDNFSSLLVQLLSDRRLCNKKVVVLGDFNVNLLTENSEPVENFISSLQSLSFLPLITQATRFPPSQSPILPSLIDHIWVNTLHQCSSGILTTDISDHLPIFMHMPIIAETSSDKIKVQFRCHSEDQVDRFRERLMLVDWTHIVDGTIDEQLELFNRTVNKLYCNCFPIKTKLISLKRLSKPWLTSGILNSIKTKTTYCKLTKFG